MVFWPEDYLVKDCPQARIMTWGYDSRVSKLFGAPVDHNIFYEHATDLLLALNRARRNDPNRPLIFVAHSLGGIIVKQVVINSDSSEFDVQLRSISENTKALVFLGTPHRGSDWAAWAEFLQRLASAAQSDTNPETVQYLQSHGEHLSELEENFGRLIRRRTFTIHTFQEGQGYQGVEGQNNRIVEPWSSSVGDPSRERVETINDNHMDMCRFSSRDSPGYKQVGFTIRNFVDDVVNDLVLGKTPSTSSPQGHIPAIRNQHEEMSNIMGSISTTLDPELSGWKATQKTSVKFPVSTVTHFRNLSFVGRDDVLRDIHEKLVTGNHEKLVTEDDEKPVTGNDDEISASSGLVCCVLHGLGGQGKSQTATEYTFRYGSHFDAIFWLKAETDPELARTYATIARRLGLTPHGSTSSSTDGEQDNDPLRDIEDARSWLENTDRKWLLIFDNLESTEDLETYLPKSSKKRGAVIITTQKAHMTSVVERFHKIPLQPLSPQDGAQLLFNSLDRRPSDPEEDSVAYQISEWVGGLPLAVATIGGFIKTSERSPQEILNSLRRSSKVWVSSGEGAVSNYKQKLATVFDLALSELGENTRHLIDIMAFLSPDDIPQEMLCRAQKNPALSFLSDEDEFLEMASNLGSRQLIRHTRAPSGEYYISIHRSLQMNVLHSLSKDEDLQKRSRVFDEAFTLVRNVVPSASRLQNSQPELWPAFNKYVPQVINLRQHALWPNPPLTLGIPFAKMLIDVGTFLWHTGQFRDCEDSLKTAESIVKDQDIAVQELHDTEEMLSDIYNFTGILADCIGVSERSESLRYRIELLRLRKKAHKAIPPSKVTVEDEIRLENAWSDLGCAYMQQGRYDEAGIIFDKMLVYFRKWGTEDQYPFEYAKYYHHSAPVLMAQGKPVQAIEFARKGLELQELHEGSLNAMALINKYDLACLLYNAGEETLSLKVHQSVLEARKQVCGEDSQFTLESYESVATLLFFQGELETAEAYLSKCLDRRHRSTWTKEGVARAQYWLSKVLSAKGDHAGAEVQLAFAKVVRDDFLEKYPKYLTEDPENEVAVFDQMLPMWISQTTGKLQDGGRCISPPRIDMSMGSVPSTSTAQTAPQLQVKSDVVGQPLEEVSKANLRMMRKRRIVTSLIMTLLSVVLLSMAVAFPESLTAILNRFVLGWGWPAWGTRREGFPRT